jgi:hypothetical protein
MSKFQGNLSNSNKIARALNIIEPIRSKSSSLETDRLKAESPNKAKAVRLLEREENQAKKSRLESLLCHQFIGKFGTKMPQSAINSFITARVHVFVSSYDSVRDTEPYLDDLEKEIRAKTNELKQEIRIVKNSARSENPDQLHFSGMNSGRFDKTSENLKTIKELAGSEGAKGNQQFSIINALMKIDEEEEKKKEQRDRISKQHQFKQGLDQQLSHQEQLKQQKERERNQQLENVRREQEKLEMEKQLNRHKKEEMFVRERESRLSQIEEVRMAKEKEKRMKIMAEQVEMERAKEFENDEVVKKLKQKEKQKQAQEQLLMENERNKELKHQQLLEKQAYEKKLTEEYE